MKRWIALASVMIGVVLVAITNAAGVGIPVLDVENLMQNVLSYAQHVITATNSATQVVNQATQIAYQARNALPLTVSLSDPAFTEFQKVNGSMSAINGLGQSLTSLTQRYNTLYGPSTSLSPQQLRDSASQQDAALTEENLNAITAQAGIVANANAGTSELQTIMDKSRAAQGNLEATQATNELVGQLVKQELKTQEMLALHSRVISSDIAQRQSEEQAARAEHSWTMRNWNNKSSASPASDFP